jgi:O-antigen/teichoic acid export membrane protein
MFNGFGLAISSQGDRFIVGIMLGLPSLAIYSVVLLVAFAPMSVLLRTLGTVILADLHNSMNQFNDNMNRLRLYAVGIPFVAGFCGLLFISFMNIITSVVFGRNFVMSDFAVALLALGVFFRIVRSEPFTALFLSQMKTASLASANFSSLSGLLASIFITYLFRTFEAPLAGKIVGEVVALAATLILSRASFRVAFSAGAFSTIFNLSIILFAAGAVLTTPIGVLPLGRFFFLGSCILRMLAGAIRSVPPLLRSAYGALYIAGPAPSSAID